MSKRFTHNGIVIVDHLKKDLIHIDGDENLLDLAEYVDRLQYENEQLKKILKFLRNDNATDILNVLNSQENQIWELKKEIEQLKKELAWWKYKCGEDLND